MTLSLFLLASLFCSVTLSSGEDYFYLAFRTNGTREEREDITGELSENSTTECTFQSERKIECSCGNVLLDASRRYEDELDSSTCGNFDEIDDNMESNFSFCANALRTLGPGYEIHPVMLNNSDRSDDIRAFTGESLRVKIMEIEDRLRLFKRVLDRTIIGVLVEAQFSKCVCFDRYKKWLCTTQLPLYNDQSADDNQCRTQLTVDTISSGDTDICELKPCISVCYDVLQTCPYYIPSRYQTPQPSQPSIEVIYGGYPAFDCPRDCSSDYAFTCQGNKIECTKRDSTCPQESNRTVVMFSILLFVLIIRTIT